MQLHFTKMHGAGNDFVVIDLISQDYKLRPQDVRRLADRHFGVGVRSGTGSRSAAQSKGGFSLPHLQCRRQRGAAVR